MLGEAVGLVADVLQQPQGIAVAAQSQRLVALGHEDHSSRLASEITVGGAIGRLPGAASAACSCPLPPSISSMSGKISPSSCSRWKRRTTTSWMLAAIVDPCHAADVHAA